MDQYCDRLVIGGGIFGSAIATALKKQNPSEKVFILEKEDRIGKRATYNNQARVHNGYHYPRSITTALRSHVNYSRFIEEYRGAIFDDFEAYYAIAGLNSKVTAGQFQAFCGQIKSPLRPAPARIRDLFNPKLIEDVFGVEEVVFDANRLASIIIDRMESVGVEVFYRTEVLSVERVDGGMRVSFARDSQKFSLIAPRVYNVTYSGLNRILRDSNLPLIPLKYEMAEMCLVELPPELARLGITVMCGPFFSIMPFPSRALHTVSHVRYTPHYEWQDPTSRDFVPQVSTSNFPVMEKDIERYLPSASKMKYRDSLFEVKVLLPKNEVNDGRPILLAKDWGIPGLTCVLGGKIDNIYDILEAMDLPA
jgi:glycine/D-amino acid oxidase-like deaminating enzyme